MISNRSTVFAFSDGLSSGELEGMSRALGEKWTARFRNAEALPLELIAVRLPEVEAFFRGMQELVWSLSQEMFSSRVITPGKTTTSDLVWWWRQRVNDLGLGTWFQPSVDVQRKGKSATDLGSDPVIERGDVLHSDLGITVARLNTDTQHLAYVLLPGETDAPAGLKQALPNANALQDRVMAELRPGRTGNEILARSRRRRGRIVVSRPQDRPRTRWAGRADRPQEGPGTVLPVEEPDRFSDQLERWLTDADVKTLGGLSEAFEEKSLAVLILLLMILPATPLPTGGITHVFEAITVVLAAQMVVGRRTVWLPRRWRDRELGDAITGTAVPDLVYTTPDPFAFTDVTDVALSTVTTSNTVTITGIRCCCSGIPQHYK